MCPWGNREWTQIWCSPWCQGWMGDIHLTTLTERSSPIWPKTNKFHRTASHKMKMTAALRCFTTCRQFDVCRKQSRAWCLFTNYLMYSGSMHRLVSKSSSRASALKSVSAEAAWYLSATRSRTLNFWWKLILKIASGSYGLREVCILSSKSMLR